MNVKTKSITIVLGLFILSACAAKTPQPTAPTPTATQDTINMVNPASAYCKDQGFKLEIRTAQNGSQYGVCKFKDNSECEEWAYYRNECKPGDMNVAPAPVATSAGIVNPASNYCVEKGGTSEIRTAQDGSQYGVCTFPGGKECDEWAFFRGKCTP